MDFFANSDQILSTSLATNRETFYVQINLVTAKILSTNELSYLRETLVRQPLSFLWTSSTITLHKPVKPRFSIADLLSYCSCILEQSFYGDQIISFFEILSSKLRTFVFPILGIGCSFFSPPLNVSVAFPNVRVLCAI